MTQNKELFQMMFFLSPNFDRKIEKFEFSADPWRGAEGWRDMVQKSFKKTSKKVFRMCPSEQSLVPYLANWR